MDEPDDIAQIREDFIERIGVMVQGEGFPRIAGRVLATLVFDGERASFGDLAENLAVSRGSISSSVRLLEDREIIRRVAKPGDRQDYFEMSEDAFVNLIENSANRARRAGKEIATTLNRLPQSQSGAHARLATYADFYDEIAVALSDAAERMRHRGQA
ncbi:MAG: MarR family transcriptional regulator [Rhodobacteraceae bacterium]|nr:MarR family transcriptional regulator [Paracoccaceae bacterium]